MEITRAQAISIFEGLGVKGSDKWTKSRMHSRLNTLHETIEDNQTIGNDDLDNLLDELIGAGSEGEEIKIVAAQSEEKPPAKEEQEEVNEKADVGVDEEEPTPVKEKKERKPAKKQPAAEEEPAPKKKKAEKAPRKASGLRVRMTKGRTYWAGAVLKKHGLQLGITDAMIAELDEMCDRRNPKESEAWLKSAWHIVSGYVETEIEEK